MRASPILVRLPCLALCAAFGASASANPSAKAPLVHVSPASRHDLSAPLFLLQPALQREHVDHEPRQFRPAQHRGAPLRDLALQAQAPALKQPPAATTYEGVGDGFSGPAGIFSVNGVPPDSDGEVGPNHYVSLVNSAFAVLSKTSGSALFGPVATNTIFAGFGGQCEAQDDGDGVVLYDSLADRWFVTQFAVSLPDPYFYQCVAVSQTGDPTGQWFRYSFPYAEFNDYGKFGVWPDGYYATYNTFAPSGASTGARLCAFDRTSMLSGAPATQQCFQLGPVFGGILPTDLDGLRAPPQGSPNYLVGFGTDSSGNGSALQLWKFQVDWDNPAKSSLSLEQDLPVNAYTQACVGAGNCIVQPPDGTTPMLDSLSDRMMFRLAYRNFGDHESLVVNHTVAAGAVTGVRWYELRDPNGAATIYQQGTFAPDAGAAAPLFRWMGSLAMDKLGDLALGYSTSSSTARPGISYTGRLAGDPLGTMSQGEAQLFAGTGSEISAGGNGSPITRWGDYSNMSIDPSDDCSFWYVDEYLLTDSAFRWHTRIGTFRFPGCTPPINEFSLALSPATSTVHPGGPSGTQIASFTVQSTATAGAREPIVLSTSALPPHLTASFNPPSITAGQSSALTITAVPGSPAVAAGGFTVIGVAPSAAHLAEATLTVIRNDFTLTLTPARQSIPSGTSKSQLVQSSLLSGSPEPIMLGVSGLPPAIFASFSRQTIMPGEQSTLILTAAPGAPMSDALFSVTGTAPSASHLAAGEAVVPDAFALSVLPGRLALPQGHSATAVVLTSLASGIPEQLLLSAVGLPAGITASFTPLAIQTGASSVVTLTATLGAPAGSSSFKVHAAGPASASDADLVVDVSSSDFSLASAPASVTLAAGRSVVLTATTSAVTGPPEQITFSVGGLPPNIQAVFAPPVVAAGASSQLTLTAQPNVAAGSASLFIAGTAFSGIHSATALLTLFSQPDANISSPVTNAVVSGLVPVSVSTAVSPGTALISVQLLVDGLPAAPPQGSLLAVFSWDSRTVPNGPHVLSIQARDLAGGANNDLRTVPIDVENNASGCGCSARSGGAGSGVLEALLLLGVCALWRSKGRLHLSAWRPGLRPGLSS